MEICKCCNQNIKEDNRTVKQNNSLHKYFELIENEIDNMGYTMDILIQKPHEMPITRHTLKDVFRYTGLRMFGKESTSELSKEEFKKVLMVFNKAIAERLHVSIEFPSKDNNL